MNDVTAVLDQAIAEAFRPQTPAVCEIQIAGEPGSGRTRMLKQLAAQAQKRGLAVVWNPSGAPADARPLVCLDDNGLAGALPVSVPPASAVVARTVLPEQPVSERAYRIGTAPLTREQFAGLLGSGLSVERRCLLYELTRGLPGWLPTLASLSDLELRALARTGLFAAPLSQHAREPAWLSPDERELASAAAVLGDPFDVTLVATVARRKVAAVLPALDALVERGVISAHIVGTPLFRFRHPLVRAVVYARIPPGARIAAHARAAEVLHEAGADPVERAVHVTRSAAPGDLPAVRLLADAADRAVGSSPERAVEWLRAARRIAPFDVPSSLRRRLAVSLWQAAEHSGDHRARRELLPELGALEDPTVMADLRARLAIDLGRHDEARELLAGGLRAASEDMAPPLRLRLALMAAVRSEIPTVRGLLAEDTRPEAAAVVALAGAMADHSTTYRTGAAAAGAFLHGLDGTALAEHLETVVRLGWAANFAEDFSAAAGLFARGSRAARRAGRSGLLPRLLLGHGWALLALGRLEEALRAAEDCETRAGTLHRPDLAGPARLLRSSVLAWRDGRRGTATVAMTSAMPAPERLWWAVVPPEGVPDVPGRGNDMRTENAPGREAHDLCARADTADDDSALGLLNEAVSGFAGQGMALWECRTRLLLSQRLARAGRLPEAAEEAGRAKALAVATGSAWLRRAAIDQQRAIGGRRPRADAALRSALSARESEIVGMVRLGLPNRDIADTLVISVKTVEAHLTRIFRKTGVRSRTALAAAAGGAARGWAGRG
ncbi:LuxR C-terminal-related transcriptional regulator [Streptomyces lonegramiae]|uniref:LuxR C-terminal-related transcriptional regulator n=1 Tax=Streptomyces lonegramiae TaxID=3075524 RepID=A0ABU2XMB0_9ACTN|nr:LuxR C-terminal-related transcriptional regulator [Streptomyces sp. DSM 41529]MDT0547053.1 LuxR C-terminal-related transcriptional regulator [Streptomyces sp. DSM 41529]